MPYFLYTVDDDGNDVFPIALRRGMLPFYELLPGDVEQYADRLAMFADRASAHAFKQSTPNAPNGRPWMREIVFYCTTRERETWQVREMNRFGDDNGPNIYMSVPWACDSWYGFGHYTPGTENDPNATSTLGVWEPALESKHYCHISTEKDEPGYVAYTPNDEYGVSNRKIRTTVARYLQQFAKAPDGSPALTTDHIASYVEQSKAMLNVQFTIAEDADEVVDVYRHGPGSCMSHRTSSYQTNGVHPTTVYTAPGDLRIAYIGTREGVSARCVVWPERKTYGRSYGDTVIRRVLEKAGYTRDEMHGAKLPAILVQGQDDCYVMPYIDGVSRANLQTINGVKYFVLAEHGDWDVQGTEGTTGSLRDNEDYCCEHCDGNFGYDDYNHTEEMCDSCYSSMWRCYQCHGRPWDDDSRNDYNGEGFCDNCYERYIRACQADGCSNEWHTTESAYRGDNATSREQRGVADYCNECSDGQRLCKSCNEFTPVEADDEAEICVECGARPRCTATLDLLTVGVERADAEPIGMRPILRPGVRKAVAFRNLPVGARIYRGASSVIAIADLHATSYAQKAYDRERGFVLWFSDEPLECYRYSFDRVVSDIPGDYMYIAEVTEEVTANV